ncbi:YceI family protein [Flavobacterium sp. RSP46]|uniref:YceI family protein n=1 Tax=Flavobacterium sp. RSP46 TaxID=2497486 RepID=UPI000F85D9E6|nr:YceI family protein [Flavobacterium sp. RSP46]RTY91591.1 YceI family protein [Flavobacterium sp. RSP46]
MKKIIQIMLLFTVIATTAQEKMVSYSGIITFEASIPLFEEVNAINEKTTCILITKTGQIICWISIKDFKFKKKMMQEHFNNNYMESNRFPTAIFKGKIAKFDLKNINTTVGEYPINGKITIRGRTKRLLFNGTLKKVDQGIELYATFPLNTDDFKIKIPFIVRSKISKNVNTKIICVLY